MTRLEKKHVWLFVFFMLWPACLLFILGELELLYTIHFHSHVNSPSVVHKVFNVKTQTALGLQPQSDGMFVFKS